MADQLQTNYASDLRHILKCVFEMNSSTPLVSENDDVIATEVTTEVIGEGQSSQGQLESSPSHDRTGSDAGHRQTNGKCLLKYTHEPAHEKTNNLGFRPGLTQTDLYSHRSRLGA